MRRLLAFAMLAAVCLFAASVARAQDVQVPSRVVAGTPASIPISGSGEATAYLFAPSHVAKRKVQLGQPIQLSAEDVSGAGRYVLIVKGGGADHAVSFFVTPGKVDSIAFLARPSRVPAARPGVISGSAYLFDAYQNLVLEPAAVSFDLTVAGAPPVSRREMSKYGIAWTRTDSGRKEGAAQFVASVAGASVRRIVQQVASDPCTIRMRAQRGNNGNIIVDTDPIRDCAGNAVPDGTIVTFTSVDAKGKSTVDSRIKRGSARAELPASDNALISVAAGVIVGNEIRWRGAR
ncbi:MAG TPA: hypothetical protein VN622_11435 [Clostridia bacterium]|nr:hypothetical protein [Clostridia bacterium]